MSDGFIKPLLWHMDGGKEWQDGERGKERLSEQVIPIFLMNSLNVTHYQGLLKKASQNIL